MGFVSRRFRRLLRRGVRFLPGLSSLISTLDATRSERDRLRTQLDAVCNERIDVARLGEPSFYARYESLRRIRTVAEDLGGQRHPIWDFNAKLPGRELAQKLGINVPELFAHAAPLSELRPPQTTGFVLKPVEGSTTRGVFAVVVENDRYRSVMDNTLFSWGELQEAAATAVAEGNIAHDFFIEALVDGLEPGVLPHDFKCYCIGGRVELVRQRDVRNSRRSKDAVFRFWDRDFRDLGAIRYADRVDSSLPPPPHPQELVAAAESIASALPSTFVRIDLYNPSSGVVFGEITPHPGGILRYNDEVDRLLGEAWERAEATELAAELGS